jgi:hypothetical protein
MNDSTYTTTMRSAALMLGLAGIIAVHVMDLPGKLTEVPYMGVMYIGVILAAGVLIHRLITGPNQHDYLAATSLAAAVIAGFVINRTIGMPGATDDIGNWTEPLGLLSLVVEAWVVALGLWAARASALVEGPATSVRAKVGVNSS